MTPRRALLVPPPAALLVAALSGCAFSASPPEGPDRATAVAIDEALLHTVAREVDALPQVTCATVTLRSAGIPYPVPGDPRVQVRTTAKGPARDALARDVGERFWRSGVTSLLTLGVDVVGPDGASDLGSVLLGDARPVEDEQLADAYGPRPSPTVTVPPSDPGDPGCP